MCFFLKSCRILGLNVDAFEGKGFQTTRPPEMVVQGRARVCESGISEVLENAGSKGPLRLTHILRMTLLAGH